LLLTWNIAVSDRLCSLWISALAPNVPPLITVHPIPGAGRFDSGRLLRGTSNPAGSCTRDRKL
jgi:hypothetical protein